MASTAPATNILNGYPIRNYDTNDPGAVALANEILGGHHQYQTLAERDAIPAERRKPGMTCRVLDTGITYVLGAGMTNADWADEQGVLESRIDDLESDAVILDSRMDDLELDVAGIEVGDSFVVENKADLPATVNGTGITRFGTVYADSVTSDNNGRYYNPDGSSTWTKVAGDLSGRVINIESVTDSRRQLKSRNALVRDHDGKVLMWQIDGLIYFRPSEELVLNVLEVGNIDISKQTATKIALFVDDLGRVPLWLENGKLAAKGFSDGLLTYLNSALNIGTPTITRWVIFLVGGQSNALGLSNDSTNWVNASAVGRKWEYSNTLLPLVEPVGASAPTGRTSTGSMWPSFAIEYNRLNPGVGVIIVPCASNGTTSAQWRADATVPVYSDPETLFQTTLTRLNACIAAVKADSSYADVRLGGVLYYQGESDSATPAATYRANLQNTIDGWRDPANFGPDFPIFLGITGYTAAIPEPTYRPIRAEQRSIAIENAYAYPGFEGMQFYLDSSGGAGTRDGTHFTQVMYNVIGKCFANTVSHSPIPTAPLK